MEKRNIGGSTIQTAVPSSFSTNGQAALLKKSPTTAQPNLAQADGPPVRSRNQAGVKKSNSQNSNSNQTNGSASGTFNENDTFNKHYNKELRVSKDEIPIVLGELNDSAVQFIKREQWEKALNLLQKAYGIMDVVDFTMCRRDKFNLFVLFHNMALCYQKLQMLEECASCIEQALELIPVDQFSLEERSISNRMRKLQMMGKLKLQYCAILSQIHRHKDALEQSKEGVRIAHHLINDLKQLCEFYVKREDIEQSYTGSNINTSQNAQQPTTNSRNTNNIGGGIGGDTEMTYNSYRSLQKEKRLNGSSTRNRSFCQFLSQQEAYNSEAAIFQQSSVSSHIRNSAFPMRQGLANESHNMSQFYNLNFLEESMSYIERTARKLMPILTEIKKRMVPEKTLKDNNRRVGQGKQQNNKEILESFREEGDVDFSADVGSESVSKKLQADMKNILGYLNQGEWTQTLSIGSIMQLQPFSVKDMLEQGKNELELTRDSFIQKVSLISVAYFCYSTEIRFILQMKEDPNYEPNLKQKESEYWHAKSLEISCSFLPSECPLLNHINLSYQKHFAPVKQTIMEEETATDDLKVVKPLNGIDNPKFQPIIRHLQNMQVAITPYQMTPLNQITSQFLSQIVSFNDYQEQGTSNQHTSFKSQMMNHPQAQLQQKGKSGDGMPQNISHKRAESYQLLNHSKNVESNTSFIKADPKQLFTDDDEIQKFEKLFEKLLRENKIDRGDLIRRFEAKDLLNLDKRESCNNSNDLLLDEQILAENNDSQVDIHDEDQIANEASRQTASNNLYKFRNNLEGVERPKTSNGNHRGNSSHNVEQDKMTQIEKISQYHKHVEEKKKSARPLSGGLQQKIKTESQRSRVTKANPHNLSMYEKFGPMVGIGASPEKMGQINQQQSYINQQPIGPKPQQNHSQFLTQVQNQPANNNSAQPQQQQKISYISSQPTQNTSQSFSKPLLTVGDKKSDPSNIQAYDELKKRLLSEYKKLTSGKKSFDEQVREKYKNLKQRAVSGKKAQSQHQIPNPNPVTTAISQTSGSIQYPAAQLSPRHHLNVYKPTFIINNSFANEGTPSHALPTTKEIEILDQMNKKYRPSSKQGQYPPTTAQPPSQQVPGQQLQPSVNPRSSSIGVNPAPQQQQQNKTFQIERQQQPINNQQLMGLLINQEKKSTASKKILKPHHQQQLSQPPPDYIKQQQYEKQQPAPPVFNQQKQQQPTVVNLKPSNGYSTQQQFNHFSQIQQQHQQQQQQFLSGNKQQLNAQIDQQLQQMHQNSKRSGSQGNGVAMIQSNNISASNSNSIKATVAAHTSQNSQQAYEKLKKKLLNY